MAGVTVVRDRRNVTPANRARHRHWLEDEAVRSWWESRRLRSALSADVDLRKLGLLVQRIHHTPRSVVSLARENPDRLRDLLVSYATRLKRQGRTDAYLVKTFRGLRNWLEFNSVEFERYPKLSTVSGSTLRSERVPTPEELRRVLSGLSPRGRAIALLMAHAGLRPGAIGGYQAENGLRLCDLPELTIGNPPAFQKLPFLIRVPAELSKTRREYVTFGTADLADAILAALSERREKGETLRPGSPLVGVNSHARSNRFRTRQGLGGFVTTKAVVFELRRALKAACPAGVTWRPYVLRSYCSTRLLFAENAGKLTRDVREAILGHDLGTAGKYHLAKRLGPETVEELRSAYERASEFLLPGSRPGEAEARERLLRLVLIAAGAAKDDVDRLEVSKLTEDELVALLGGVQSGKQRAMGSQSSSLGEPNGQHRTQAVVSLGEVRDRLEAGWEYVAPLGPDRAVLRAPG
jgi:hypothetical protein